MLLPPRRVAGSMLWRKPIFPCRIDRALLRIDDDFVQPRVHLDLPPPHYGGRAGPN
jgi:hypothetical protein